LNQFNWTYIDDYNKQFHVALLHGANTGHLLVHCNTKIVLIDFSVLDSKKYTFFIGEELCEIILDRRDDSFYYDFKVNRNADTPLNRERKEQDKKYLKQSIIALALLIGLVGTVVISLTLWNNNKKTSPEALNIVGKEAVAQVKIEGEGKARKVGYFFIADSKTYKAKADVAFLNDMILLKNGMPLESGDEFLVKYIPDNPDRNMIDYSRPSAQQVEMYKHRAINKYLQYHSSVDSLRGACIIELAFEAKGIKGLADFYFQDISPDKNPHHNSNSFKRLIRDIPFKKMIDEKCWNK